MVPQLVSHAPSRGRLADRLLRVLLIALVMDATVSGKAPSLEDAVPPGGARLGDEDGGVAVDGAVLGGAGADAGGAAVSGGGLEGTMPL